ncbi:hexuronate transporter [Variibacter gotjawalensis]|uniref:Hexuronate transporter n=1 Tax=Variibacter gotjawalensis TaxID=1333996 RepID=A0A0S3PUV0_9BRAD|nr:MFS transporter [Variibacter gotjawalensis]NIK50029.1 MFS family permease [Variibacter gotjawalensis]RZS46028.1 sugar phosphate permease [Variibacter gotjawalensis]BAT59703.1 hexuronate transporter [Variibacter gotjawalensis]
MSGGASGPGPATQAPNAWSVLFLLFAANLFNFFDRTIPAIIAEPIRHEWNLSDFQLGIIGAAFTVIYAIAGLPLGRMSDTGSRKKIMAWGLIAWSACTAAGGAAWSFGSFLFSRVAVGIGESAYAPAATSLIGDLFPANKRSRAMGIYMLGLPLGLLLCFFSVGAIVKYFDSWRAPLILAMFPGLVIAVAMFFIKEPARGAAESTKVAQTPVANPIRKILKIKTLWWVTLASITLNFASYAANGFLVVLCVRYFKMSLGDASISVGVIAGISGLIGLVFGGYVADFAHKKSEFGRLYLGAAGLVISGVLTWYALTLSASQAMLFIFVFSIGWLFQYAFYVSVYPAIQDVVEPRLRATAMAIHFGALYILGGAWGSMVVGGLSDYYAHQAMEAAGATKMAEIYKATGLHDAMFLVPICLVATGVAIFFASRTLPADAKAMLEGTAADVAGAAPATGGLVKGTA